MFENSHYEKSIQRRRHTESLLLNEELWPVMRHPEKRYEHTPTEKWKAGEYTKHEFPLCHDRAVFYPTTKNTSAKKDTLRAYHHLALFAPPLMTIALGTYILLSAKGLPF